MANENLEKMKYSELQKIAKQFGIKANMKADKLIKAILEQQNDVRGQGSVEEKNGEKPFKDEPLPTEASKDAIISRGRGQKRSREVVKEVNALTDNTNTKKRTKKQEFSNAPETTGKNAKRTKSADRKVTVTVVTDNKTKTPQSTSYKKTPPVVKITPKTRTKSVDTKTPVDEVKTTMPKSMSTGNKKTSAVMKVTPKTPLGSAKSQTSIKAKTPKPVAFRSKTPAKKSNIPSKKMSRNRSSSRSRTPKSDEPVTKISVVEAGGKTENTRKGRDQNKKTEPKLNSTYELEKENSIHEDQKEEKKAKRDTFEIIKDEKRKTRQSASPGVKGMLDSLKPEMSSDQMKNSLMAAINKNVEEKKSTKAPVDHKSIPRFAAFLAKKKEAVASAKKPITPGNKDWAKIHQRQFDKLDSIDSYLQKKRKRIETLTTSVKKAKLTAEETQNAVERLKKNGAKVVKPVARKSPPGTAGFVPSVTSTTNMTLNFTSTTKPRFSAGRVMKTPGVTRDIKVVKPTTCTKENAEKRKSQGVHLGKKTPFKPGNESICASPKKPVFNLKESLSKPLSWKPYMGKLKSVENGKPTISAAKTPRKELVKQCKDMVKNKQGPRPLTKDDRRKAAAEQRANRKFDDQMKRRGIVS